MSHPAQREFIKRLANSLPHHFSGADVLEIGSLNINGSVRDFFSDCRYLGLDVGAGRDVDLVCEGQKYEGADGSFDHVISCEAMEHNPYWKETFLNMTRLCRPGGLVTMTCATTGRAEHGTTKSSPISSPLTIGHGWTYYRNLKKQDFLANCDIDANYFRYKFWTNWQSFDLYFIGLRSGKDNHDVSAGAWTVAVNAIDQYLAAANASRSSKYRAAMARIGGDAWFDFMRGVALRLTYVHNS